MLGSATLLPDNSSFITQSTNTNIIQKKRTHIICFRHGETDFNKGGKIQGQVDVLKSQLNSEGKQQASDLG
nr:histidine phosphatase family protein [Parachlamydiaceae bacterium]